MRRINKTAVTVDTTAGGTNLLTTAEQSTLNMEYVAVNPSVEVFLVGASGTAANSPEPLPVGVVTYVRHQAGPLKAITASGSSTVKVAILCGP